MFYIIIVNYCIFNFSLKNALNTKLDKNSFSIMSNHDIDLILES